MKFPIDDFFSKCDQIRRKLRIWSHLLKKSLKENFIFRAVLTPFIDDFCLQHSWRSFQWWKYVLKSLEALNSSQ